MGVARNPLGQQYAWRFLRDNWSVFNHTSFGTERIIYGVTGEFDTEDQYESVKNFFSSTAQRWKATMDRALEVIRDNIEWNRKYGGVIKQWLETEIN